jgi:LmbE family N-acetylglucosaminyl deacetylase
MKFESSEVDIFIPDQLPLEEALKRTTHLSIAAHQDDVEIMAYQGISECYRKRELWFGAVILTDGRGSPRTGRYAQYSDEQMKNLRLEEQRQAAKIGEYSFVIQLSYPSTTLKDKSNHSPVNDLVTILQNFNPQKVYLHNLADKHPTHLASAARAITALRETYKNHVPSEIWGCEVWRGLDWMIDKDRQCLDTSAYPELALKIVQIFDSQISGGKRYDQAIMGRRLANATFSESHDVDHFNSVNFAMNLRPLLTNPSLSLTKFVDQHIANFSLEIQKNLGYLE